MKNMFKKIDSVSIFSSDAAKLADFYKTKVGIEFTIEAEMGEEGQNLFGFEPKTGSGFYIVDHSQIKGTSKEPMRTIINFEVDDIEEMSKKLQKNDVKLIQDVYHVENYGFIATFEDIDGNYFQIVKVRA